MGSFDSLDTAARVRQIIQKGASREISVQIQRPIVGRVISVDLPNLNAMVWFSGDPQPIPVTLLSSTIPGAWARRFDSSGASATNSATEGFGSMAVCQRFNGTLYITDVITGGQFSYNLSSLNMTVQELLPYDGSGDIAGTSRRALVSMKVSSFFATVPNGGGVMFGPFMAPGNDSPTAGNTTVLVSDGVSSKRYDFTFVLSTLTDTIHASYLDQWYRILPESESLAVGTDWDLDVAYRETPHGLDRGVFQSQEIWFRIINRNGSAHEINHTVSIDSDLFQRPQGFDNRYSCEIVQTCSLPIGYLGLNEPGTSQPPISDAYGMDTFGRVVASPNFGQADTHELWDEANGTGFVDGTRAYLTLTATNQLHYKSITPDVNGASLINVDQMAVFSVPAMASGANLRAGIMWRWTSASSFYRAIILFRTDGFVGWEIVKTVAGVDTTINSFTSAIAYTANQRWAIRVSMDGSAYTMIIWRYDTEFPATSTLTAVGTDSSIAGSGKMGVRFSQPSGGTNTYPLSVSVHLWKGGNSSAGQVQVSGTTPWRSGAWRSGLLRAASSLQLTVASVGDPIIWDTTHVQLPSFVTLDGIGVHRDILAEGKTVFTPPVVGAQVPIVPLGTFATVTSAGIPLSRNQSLWLAVPPGALYENLRSNLFIVDSTAGEMQIPEWAVLICHTPYFGGLISPLEVEQQTDRARGVIPGSFTTSTSNTSAITSGTAMQTASVTFRKQRAFKIVYRTHIIGSVAGAFANVFLRAGSGSPSSGDIYGPVRSPVQVTASPGNYMQVSAEFINSGGSDVSGTAAIVCTNTSGTCTHIGDSAKPRILYVEDIGRSSDYPGLISVA